MGILKEEPIITSYLKFGIDALYFNAACQNYHFAVQHWPKVFNGQKEYRHLIEQRNELEKRLGDDAVEENPIFYEAMSKIEFQAITIRKMFNPSLQYMATIHILCAGSLEAHINAIAKSALSGVIFDSFEKAPLELKWHTLPKLINLNGFKNGEEPFQNFSRLVKFRNALLHYKSKKEKWTSPDRMPEFLEKLGLTLPLSKRSIDTVADMVIGLSKQMGKSVPDWLNLQETEYIDVDFDIE